ncbi:hypothetical protein [Paraflavitalea speifideaquila]|uniref:hypothetical protein n=1 Tax=Paraflavitalea speifideaquila TaxID=3076558 RepID=UPI0028EE0255|nr:hypothetical protein [Paraflavitalea speifideiaquila]
MSPFIVHWDSVAFVENTHTAKGHIMVRVHYKLSSFTIPVALKLEIELLPSGYRYSIRHLEANKRTANTFSPSNRSPRLSPL